MKKKKEYDGYGGCMIIAVVFILLLVIGLMSCSKELPGVYEKVNCNYYTGEIKYFQMDSVTPLIMKIGDAKGKSHFVFYADTLCDTHFKYRKTDTTFHYINSNIIDTTYGVWLKMCPQPGQNFLWMEYWYYTKNGKEIIKSVK